jgi:hypothetical protein
VVLVRSESPGRLDWPLRRSRLEIDGARRGPTLREFRRGSHRGAPWRECQAASHARPVNDASFAKSPQGNDAKCGAACDTIAVKQDYFFTSMPQRSGNRDRPGL